MIKQLTVKEILTKAIQREIEAQKLYRDLSGNVTNEATQDMLRELSRVEEKHEDLLRRYMRGEMAEGALGKDDMLDYRIAEHLEQPPITKDMRLDRVLLLAANREKASHEFYLDLALAHPPGKTRTLIEELASQELVHKQRVESLYTEVAFPQTDGG